VQTQLLQIRGTVTLLIPVFWLIMKTNENFKKIAFISAYGKCRFTNVLSHFFASFSLVILLQFYHSPS